MVAICDQEPRYRCDQQPSAQCMIPDRSAVPPSDSRFPSDRCAGFPKSRKEKLVDTSTLYTTLHIPARFEKSCRKNGMDYISLKCITYMLVCSLQIYSKAMVCRIWKVPIHCIKQLALNTDGLRQVLTLFHRG